MKFPPDTISDEQEAAYVEIAGNAKKLATLEPGDCDCEKSKPQDPKVPVTELGVAAGLAAWALYILSRGRTLRPPFVPAF